MFGAWSDVERRPRSFRSTSDPQGPCIVSENSSRRSSCQCRFASSQAKMIFGFVNAQPKVHNCGKPQCNWRRRPWTSYRLSSIESSVCKPLSLTFFDGSSPTSVDHSTVLASSRDATRRLTPVPRCGIQDDACARRSAARQVGTKGCRRQSNKGMTLTHAAAGWERSGSNIVRRCKRIHATCKSLSATPRRARPWE
jgi:hypothetical protein